MAIAIGRGARLSRTAMNDLCQRHGLCPVGVNFFVQANQDTFNKALHARGLDQGRKVHFLLPGGETLWEAGRYLFTCYDWSYIIAAKDFDLALQKVMSRDSIEAVGKIEEGGRLGTWFVIVSGDMDAQENVYRHSVSVTRKNPDRSRLDVLPQGDRDTDLQGHRNLSPASSTKGSSTTSQHFTIIHGRHIIWKAEWCPTHR
jgi:hypothetical protein